MKTRGVCPTCFTDVRLEGDVVLAHKRSGMRDEKPCHGAGLLALDELPEDQELLIRLLQATLRQTDFLVLSEARALRMARHVYWELRARNARLARSIAAQPPALPRR